MVWCGVVWCGVVWCGGQLGLGVVIGSCGWRGVEGVGVEGERLGTARMVWCAIVVARMGGSGNAKK